MLCAILFYIFSSWNFCGPNGLGPDTSETRFTAADIILRSFDIVIFLSEC